LGSHHDSQYPFGTVSPNGFTDRATEITVTPQPGPNGRMVAVAVYTPPTLFPYLLSGQPAATTDVQLTIEADSGQLGETTLRLVRPPLLVQHGLFGSAARAIGQDMQNTLNANGFLFFTPDFGPRNISGFDQVYDVLPRAVAGVAAGLRNGHGDAGLRSAPTLSKTVAGKKLAITTVDVLAHSMGGVLARWYTTDRIAGSVPPSLPAVPPPTPEPREIHYPTTGTVNAGILSGTGPTALEGRYTSMQRQRVSNLNYRRADNFYRGDFGSVVVYGSPLRGSPLGNEVTHEMCAQDLRQQCFQPPPPKTSLTRYGIYWLARPKPASAPDSRTQPDAGAAIYDLSIGSAAYQLFLFDSDPVRVHAIGTTASALSGQPLPELASWVTNPTHYCQGFDRTTSDRVVPIESQLANFAHGHYTRIDDAAWHEEQDQDLSVQRRVVRLLVDAPANPDPIANFEDKFPGDIGCYPLECGAPQCQPK
ncbi:MAG: hypothetical protein HY699_08900, partial [Deltaproteobacteria bacterium]|nr:hypothetical protein [Deltaproteobacteria bacterium]